jgi:hypothetical protein
MRRISGEWHCRRRTELGEQKSQGMMKPSEIEAHTVNNSVSGANAASELGSSR